METYGYCRVSSSSQCEFRQIMAMNELQIPPTNIFVDKQSGKDFDRPAYKELVAKIYKQWKIFSVMCEYK